MVCCTAVIATIGARVNITVVMAPLSLLCCCCFAVVAGIAAVGSCRAGSRTLSALRVCMCGCV